MSQSYVGQIIMFGGNFAPVGWESCNGQLLQIANYQQLFSIIGNMYGGNGTTDFAVPNMQGRVPVNQGQGVGLPYWSLGQTSNALTVPSGSSANSTIPGLCVNFLIATTGTYPTKG